MLVIREGLVPLFQGMEAIEASYALASRQCPLAQLLEEAGGQSLVSSQYDSQQSDSMCEEAITPSLIAAGLIGKQTLMDAFQVTSGDVNRLVKNAMSFSPPMTTLIPVSFASKWFNTLQKGKVTLNKIVTEEYTKQDLRKDFQMPFGDIYLLIKATEIMKVTYTVNDMAATTIKDSVRCSSM
jgi:hypothetical protein